MSALKVQFFKRFVSSLTVVCCSGAPGDDVVVHA